MAAQQHVAQWPAFSENPTLYAACVVVALCIALVLKSLINGLRMDYIMRALPTPPGALPIFGHALKLLSGTPWDLMEDWARENKGKLVRIQVRKITVEWFFP